MSNNQKLAFLGVVAVFVLICISIAIRTHHEQEHKKQLLSKPLLESKKTHQTNLTTKAPVQGSFRMPPPPEARAVTYQSDGRQLLAWIVTKKRPYGAPVTMTQERHPGLLYCHGGYAIHADTVSEVRPYTNKGFVVLIPTWRGENGNPGNYEMCYGEVDDAANALDYLRSMPNVDREQVFATGIGMGGTIAMLLAESTSNLKKAAACSAYPNMFEAGPYSGAPFDPKDDQELNLRSPARHVNSLKCPLYLEYGNEDEESRKYLLQAREMKKDGKDLGKDITVQEISDVNQKTVIPLANRLIARFFLQSK